MEKNSYNVIGVMSGTSLDGVDLVYVKLQKKEQWQYKILEAQTVAYTKYWKNKLLHAIRLSKSSLTTLDNDYTVYLASIIKDFINTREITELDFICSHGHTIFHEPEKGLTYQIGNQSQLADLLEYTVICDFRIADVQLGGQGAPLVPIGDALLFPTYSYCLNLGGFANISYATNDSHVAFDICAVNTVLNYYAEQLQLPYDDGGAIARTGNVHEPLLAELNQLAFYKSTPPKSLGIEWVVKTIFPIIKSYDLPIKDILRTYVVHIAFQISQVINEGGKTLVTGGGAYHKLLIEELEALTSTTIIVPEKQLVEYKEALIFGLLGVLKVRNEVNCLKSVTGASKNHSSGEIYHPTPVFL